MKVEKGEKNKLLAEAGPLDIILTGNIGSAKTTIGQRLALQCGYHFYDEPIEKWNFLLNEIYKNGRTELLPLFQWQVLFHYASITEDIIKMQKSDTKRPPIVVARSPACAMLFVEANASAFTEKFRAAIRAFVRMLEEHPFWRDAKYVYLYQPAEACFRNMNARGGVENNTVPLVYLEHLECMHNVCADKYGWQTVDAANLDKCFAHVLQARKTNRNFIQKEKEEKEEDSVSVSDSGANGNEDGSENGVVRARIASFSELMRTSVRYNSLSEGGKK